MAASPAERRLAAQQAAHARWSRTRDRTAATAAARNGLLAKYERQVDPDGTLTPELRRKLAENARQEQLKAMSRQSAVSRRKQRERECG